ncbi:MAG: Uma2 family endonuclease [Mobilicoccus sp.]|nr:Uma2 family endonuclease [Mobilicoccus sp.]
MAPSEATRNAIMAMALYDILSPIVKPEHLLLPHHGVRLPRPAGVDTVRQPDLQVTHLDVDEARPYVEAEQVLLAVEVVSPSSIERDWVTKRADYAAAGDGWRVTLRIGRHLIPLEATDLHRR